MQKIKQQLEEELARLLGRIEERQARQGRRTGANLDRDDLAHNFALRERQLALHDVERSRVTQIKKALERISEGIYGACERCGDPISRERLEIIPYATLCVPCQQKQDQN